jgi:penicillin amidase
MNRILGILLGVFVATATLFLNGNIHIPNNPLPPVGKLLDPHNGIWATQEYESSFSIKNINKTSGHTEVKYDEHHIPHLYSNDIHSLLYAQGFIEARDRLFQMQFLKAAAAGELSELFGEKTIDIDIKNRVLGLGYAAEKTYATIEANPEERDLYQAYANGVNGYIATLSPRDYPFEFKLFNKKPKKWDVLSSIYIYKYMANILAGGNDDIEMTNLKKLLGESIFEKLYPEREKFDTPIIPNEVVYNFDTIYGNPFLRDSLVNEIIYKAELPKRNVGVGSNNWAVNGNKTVTGSPILCNDPHLSLTLPSIWYAQNLITDDFNAYGVSFPGLPGIMIGFNENIAWGETNVGQDIEDLFLIRWANEERTKYYLDDKIVDVDIRKEIIKVNGKKDVELDIKYTYWGPIVHRSKNGKQDLAKRWIVLDEAKRGDAATFIKGMQCKDYDCYLEATQNFGTPAQNFLFASKTGDIALRVNGKLPVRHNEDGRFVAYGDNSNFDFNDFIPREQNPQCLNPDRNYIFSANQYSTDKDYPYYYTGGFERYRNRVVDSLLKHDNQFTIDKMKKMQQNVYNVKAADMAPVILELIDKNILDSDGLSFFEILSNWDYQYNKESPAPTLFEYLLDRINSNTWEEISTYNDTMAIKMPLNFVLLDLLKNEPENQFFDNRNTIQKETAADIINKSFKEMVKFGKEKNQNNTLKWGEYRNVKIPHITRIAALGSSRIKLSGNEDVINAINYTFGPSWRMVVSLEEKVKAFGIYPGGQSGDPRSEFYTNMLNNWVEGEYIPLNVAKIEDHQLKLAN